MNQMCAVVLEDPFVEGRYLLCRRTPHGLTTVVSSHCERVSADRERRKLQASYDRVEPERKGQLVFGFYGPEYGDV